MGMGFSSPAGTTPAFALVTKTTVGVGGAGSVVFSGLDLNGDTDGQYLVVARVGAANIDAVYLYMNNDATATHYHHTRFYTADGTAGGEAANNAICGGNLDATTGGIIEVLATRTPAGYLMGRCHTWATNGRQIAFACVQRDFNTQTNLTEVRLDSLTSNFPEGSVFYLYKSVKQ